MRVENWNIIVTVQHLFVMIVFCVYTVRKMNKFLVMVKLRLDKLEVNIN